MIDTSTEKILTLAEAAAELPRRRRGRKTHISTLYRWTLSGCRGVVLECVQIGATRATSREALARFFDRLTRASLGDDTPSDLRTMDRRQRESEAAAKKLEEMGA
jgi:Protein of unknown function (DUF1580)